MGLSFSNERENDFVLYMVELSNIVQLSWAKLIRGVREEMVILLRVIYHRKMLGSFAGSANLCSSWGPCICKY